MKRNACVTGSRFIRDSLSAFESGRRRPSEGAFRLADAGAAFDDLGHRRRAAISR